MAQFRVPKYARNCAVGDYIGTDNPIVSKLDRARCVDYLELRKFMQALDA
jgi:hypothetical protein